jgi:hypothetical protein
LNTSGDDEEKTKIVYQELTELQRVRAMVDDVTDATNLAPVGSHLINADGSIVPNPLFPGLKYPDKLESYYHQHQGPRGVKADAICKVREWIDQGLRSTI